MKNSKKWEWVLTLLLVVFLHAPFVHAAAPLEDPLSSKDPSICLMPPAPPSPLGDALSKGTPWESVQAPLAPAPAQSVVDEASKPPLSEDFTFYDVPLSKELQRYTFDLAKSYGVDYKMVLSVMYVESKFQPSIRSKNTNGTVDSGLMQVNSGYKKWQASIAQIPLAEYDVIDPYDNIRVGIAELAYARDYWAERGITGANLDLYMLNSYNMGIGGYTKYVKSGALHRSYDRKVLAYRDTALVPKK